MPSSSPLPRSRPKAWRRTWRSPNRSWSKWSSALRWLRHACQPHHAPLRLCLDSEYEALKQHHRHSMADCAKQVKLLTESLEEEHSKVANLEGELHTSTTLVHVRVHCMSTPVEQR